MLVLAGASFCALVLQRSSRANALRHPQQQTDCENNHPWGNDTSSI